MNSVELDAHIQRNCPRVAAYLRDHPDPGELLADLSQTSLPRHAVNRLDDLYAAAPQILEPILSVPERRRHLVDLIAGSRYLFGILSRHPAKMEELFTGEVLRVRRTRHDHDTALAAMMENVPALSDVDRMLRHYKEREYLRIGGRDILGFADVREVTAELSDLAGACVHAALHYHFQRLIARYGAPPASAGALGITALGMGKLSGRELNFSSDVDLIFLRELDEGRTAGPETVNIRVFYDRLVQSVAKSLSQVTEDGFVFRIDLRLRPEGEKGELAPSTANALDYYLGWGRTWERAALMKASAIAGDIALGREFLDELRPFIYRKFLDFSTIEDMRSMKRDIEVGLRRKPGINIKLGKGGIREIEFFVQALQLINAGRNPRVRTPSTLEALDLLREANLVSKVDADVLRDAYLFFRLTEHRIQINHQLQTHELPGAEADREELALRMGYKNPGALPRFMEDLERRRRAVGELFSGMFAHGEGELTDQSAPVKRILDSLDDVEACSKVLTELGFQDPVSSCRILDGLMHPTTKKIPSDRGKQLLQKLTPLFLEEVIRAPEPSQAINALDAYVDSLYAHSGYFSTLLENPATIRFIAGILAESRFFADLLIRRPQAIDSLIARGAQEYPKSRDTLDGELGRRVAYCENLEEELDLLRRFKYEELLLIGVHHLAGEIDSVKARALVSELAEVCLSGAVDIALREMIRKYGRNEIFDALPFLVLGMGKLGGAEMTYLSDLDVIFLYDPSVGAIGRFSAHEWFSRFAGRIISILSLPTAEGLCWAIDTRLRPSGNKGPLVTSMDSFRDYHRSGAQLWEKQALIKARPVVGPSSLRDDALAIRRENIQSTMIGSAELAEIARVRKRMETELALEDHSHVDLKTGQGGLVDVEFYVQAKALSRSGDFLEAPPQNTLNCLASLHNEGLVSDSDFETLDSGYRFLTNLEDRLRIMEHKSIDRMPLAGEKLKALARRLGYEEGDESRLVQDYRNVTGGIRAAYIRYFGSA